MLNRRIFLFSSIAAVPVVGLSLQSALAATKPEVYATDGVAINGFDPVGYFDGGPLRGDPKITSDWRGATWQFANAMNKAKFDADPAAFAPKYGGYCAYAVSKGGTASTDPDAWSVVDRKLYLNYSKTVRGIWSKDIPGNIAKADANWPKVLST